MNLIRRLKFKYRLLLNYLSVIMMLNGCILLLPLTILLFYPGEAHQASFFIMPAAAITAIGFLLWRMSKDSANRVSLSIHEGGIVVVSAWLVTCLVSASPFILAGTLNFRQAVFEAVSGWTTTGLSVVDVTNTTHLFLFWRSLMQLFGGAGIAVVVLASIIGPSGKGLYRAEGRSDLLLPNITKSTKLIMIIYLGYILAGSLLYTLVGMPLFDALNHSIAALSTGGFSTLSGSIGQYDNLAIELVTLILMLTGTINFAAHFILLKKEFKRFIKLGEIKTMFFLLSVAIPLTVYFSLINLYQSTAKAVRVAVFELVSALSTTGFSTVSYSDWNDFALLMMILLMLVGGGTGSTAGGIKQYRIYVLYKKLQQSLKNFTQPPQQIDELAINQPEGTTYLDKNNISEIANFVFAYIVIYFIGVAIITAHGYPLKSAMFEFASSLGTVGLSVGITAADAPPLVLWTETVGMFLGRLEIFVIIYAFSKLSKDLAIILKRSQQN